MPSKVFNATVALNNYLENAVPIAIKNASEKITIKGEKPTPLGVGWIA